MADAAKPTAIGQALNSHDGAVFSVVFSPDGSMLATGDYDDTIRLWNVKNPYSAFLIGRPISGHSAIVSAVAFSPDGTMLASGSWDHTARLWSIPRTILNLAWSPDGNILASGSIDGTIRLWDRRLSSAQRWICRAAGGALTRAEWQHYLPDLPYQPVCPQ